MPYVDASPASASLPTSPLVRVENSTFSYRRQSRDTPSVGSLNYEKINQIMGVLACVAQEFYRRVAEPYEEQKRKNNNLPECA
jgi:hypothetical protein